MWAFFRLEPTTPPPGCPSTAAMWGAGGGGHSPKPPPERGTPPPPPSPPLGAASSRPLPRDVPWGEHMLDRHYFEKVLPDQLRLLDHPVARLTLTADTGVEYEVRA